MKTQDLDRFRVLSEPRLHPVEDLAVFVTVRMNLDKDRYDATLWVADAAGVRELPGAKDVRSPEWSPDGAVLACLEKVPDDPDDKSEDAEKHAQLAILDDPRGGGSARILTRYALGVSKFAWSPAGDRIVVVAGEYEKAWVKLTVKERAKRPRRITH